MRRTHRSRKESVKDFAYLVLFLTALLIAGTDFDGASTPDIVAGTPANDYAAAVQAALQGPS